MQPNGLPAPPAYSGPGAAAVNAAQEKFAGANQAQASALENAPAPGFGNTDQMLKGYENSLLTSGPISSALGFEKYAQTYQGLPANLGNFSPGLASAYSAILGSTGSGAPQSSINKKVGSNLTGGGITTPGSPSSTG